MAGEGRWDLRVTITYRDPEAALGDAYGAAAAAEMDRLYTDVAAHTVEEARRFRLVEAGPADIPAERFVLPAKPATRAEIAREVKRSSPPSP